MGEKKSHVKRFLEHHPICCFCGGGATATTQDHWPSRAVFVGRLWPEGYVYPACEACNRISRLDEPLMALICRIRYPEPIGDSREWERILDGIRYSMPDVANSLLLSISEKRAELRKRKIVMPRGMTWRDLPLISIEHPRFHEAAGRFATKLFASLYYKHTGRILGHEARIFFVWRTNIDSFDDLFADPMVVKLLAHFPELKRQNRTLNDQFSYRYNVAEVEPPSAVFGAVFNNAVAMLGVVMGDVSHFNLPMPDDILLRPFTHA